MKRNPKTNTIHLMYTEDEVSALLHDLDAYVDNFDYLHEDERGFLIKLIQIARLLQRKDEPLRLSQYQLCELLGSWMSMEEVWLYVNALSMHQSIYTKVINKHRHSYFCSSSILTAISDGPYHIKFSFDLFIQRLIDDYEAPAIINKVTTNVMDY